jgi:hypothetical protein
MSSKQISSLCLVLGGIAVVAFLAMLVINAQRRAEERLQQTLDRYRQEWIETHLRELRSGKSDTIHFYDTQRTDELLQIFAGMREVRQMGFELTDVSQDGMKIVRDFPNLQKLMLYGGRPNVNDTGLRHLKGHEQLEELMLINTEVTDRGLEVLATLRKLRSLTLYRERFREVTLTDDALTTVRELRNLQDLNISGGWASDEAVRQLQADMPSCKITTEDPEW